ncbi:MAG TPA: LacI family transcriptional regulator [Firmicutes bacterium]|nr:LacI family transcriptional regulator [Bacillota bacterium]
MPTMRDVAKKAGVSIATVSAVVNNNKPVSTPLRRRVLTAIEELGYRPNLMARALQTRKSGNLAFLVTSIANPFFTSVLQAVENAAIKKGYCVFVGNTEGDQSKVAFYKERIPAMGVDGLLVVLSWDIAASDLIQTFLRQKIPVVGVAGSRVTPAIDCFVSADEAAGEQAARYLIGLGHRHIAFVGAKDSETTRLRYGGVRKALAELGMEEDPRLLVLADGYSERDAYEAVGTLIGRNVSFTAIVAFNDVMAHGVLNALIDQGLSVPERVSVVGFDDTVSQYTRPKLTTIACPSRELGEKGLEKLLARLEGDDSPPQIYHLPTRLIVRQSTRCPAL